MNVACFGAAEITLIAIASVATAITCGVAWGRVSIVSWITSIFTLAFAVAYVLQVAPLLLFAASSIYLQTALVSLAQYATRRRATAQTLFIFGATIIMVALAVQNDPLALTTLLLLVYGAASALIWGVIAVYWTRSLGAIAVALAYFIANILLLVARPVCLSNSNPCVLNILILVSCILTQLATAVAVYVVPTARGADAKKDK